MQKLCDIGEFGLIGRLAKLFPGGKDVISGIGDDCAVIKHLGRCLLFTTDALIEDVHFDLRYTPPVLLGYKSLAINLSDIAAMAGKPLAAVVTLGAPPETKVDFILDFARGLRTCASKYKCPIVGGDTVKSMKGIIINVAVVGECTGDPVLRSRAKPGEFVAIAGALGESLAGLNLLRIKARKAKLESGDKIYRQKIVRAHLKPEPLLKDALALKSALRITSMIDVSDGLSSELNHISRESGVKILVDADKIPLSKQLRKFCRETGENPLEMALIGGEDYALLFTFPKSRRARLGRVPARAQLTVIGEVQRGKGVFLKKAGKVNQLSARSFAHF